MTSTASLGRLERVELREAWVNEAGGFTPWLAQADNLTLLSDAIGLELECEAQEKNVGPFRADILCKDMATGHWVLIENQLERTDHTHLGQLLTYAAGLKAVTIVWIAPRFTEEHRATLDWLNEITDERFSFFGLEVELWRIGGSPAAPKFNVVCKPNDWSKTVNEAANLIGDGAQTETGKLYLDYWQALKQHLEAKNSVIRIGKPPRGHWTIFSIGRKNFYLTAIIRQKNSTGAVQLGIYGANHVDIFHILQEQANEINAELGSGLDWEELPDRKTESRIRRTFLNWDPANRTDWPRQHEQFRQELEKFRTCFAGRIRTLELPE